MQNELPEKLRAAFGRFQARDLAGAERLCGEVLGETPRHPDALHLLGVVRLAGGKPGEAITLINQALEGRSQDAAMLENLGIAYLALGNFAAAEALFRDALTLGASHALLFMRLGLALSSQGKLADGVAVLREAAARAPGDPDVHLNLGNALAERGDVAEALACYRRVLSLQRDHPAANFNLGNLHRIAGRLAEAEDAYMRVLAVVPNSADAHNNLGLVYQLQHRLDEAAASLRQALALKPDHVHALSNLGNVLRERGELDAAAGSCERALALQPDFIDALVNLGTVRVEQGRPGDAQVLYERAVRLNPRIVDAWRNLGKLFMDQGRLGVAIDSYRRALELDRGQAHAHVELGAAHLHAGSLDQAEASFRSALEISPDHADASFNLAEALKLQGRLDEAAATYERVLARDPRHLQALSGLLHAQQHMSSWDGMDERWQRLQKELGTGGDGWVSPFSVLSLPSTPAQQRACAEAWARRNVEPAARPALGFDFSKRGKRDRLRVGYLSWDFRQHATAYLIAELFELHDRNRFEIFGYSYGIDDGSAIRARIRNGCEHFSDVAGESFVETAQRIQRDGIDVLVDLKGYTLGSRPRILALRPAPVQVNWLGFPATMGSDCVDYIIVDGFIVREGQERHYAEKVVRLPDCYQVNDRLREVSDRVPSREECGLPADAFVFCCFNQTYKILPDVYESWMRILRATPGSVLWLLETNRWASENLRRYATEQGVSAERIAFAPHQPVADHLARYRLADLALDTFPYTSHTTASDALWMGCPLVTRAGDTFASRVAGSVLTCAGLRDLVTDRPEDFERLAVELATAPGRLRDLRRRVAEGRNSSPLFDTPRFVGNLENAYEMMFNAFLGRAF